MSSYLEVLPPLPAMSAHKIEVFGYSAEQMQEYARAAMAAMLAAAPSPQQPAEPLVMRNMGDSEATFIADAERLNCPACGGSGHVDDAKPAAPQQDGWAMFISTPRGRNHFSRLAARWQSGTDATDLYHTLDLLAENIATTPPQPAARRVTEETVLGHLPAPIRNPEAWPPNYADGWNDCARIAADGVCESFANGGA